MNVLPPVPEMQRAWRAADASYDGVFFLGVRTEPKYSTFCGLGFTGVRQEGLQKMPVVRTPRKNTPS
jgi:hypothetical protein